MKNRLGFLGFLFIVAGATLATPAFALDVSYSTTGAFNCSVAQYTCSGSTLTGPNGLNITFTGQPEQFPNVSLGNVTNAFFGTFTVTGESKSGGSNPLDTLPNGINFTLTVTQEVPNSGSQNLTDSAFNVTGKIQVANSSATVVFNEAPGNPYFQLTTDPISGLPAVEFELLNSAGNVTYWVDQTTKIIAQTCANANCTVTNPGVSTIEGSIVPEPAFWGLTGIGFVGLFVMAFDRARKKKVTAATE